MFGYFKRKHYMVNCPVCNREFSIKFNPEEVKRFNYEYREGAGVVYTLECDFCGAEGKIVQFQSGEVETVDHKWGKTEKEHRDEIDGVRARVEEMKKTLEKEGENDALKSRLEKDEKELEKLENVFRAQVKKYESFKTEWQEKWLEELKHI